MAITHKGGGYYELSDGSTVRGKGAAEKAENALSRPKKKSRAQVKDPNPDLTTTTKKSLDAMSDAHRRKIERWEPMLEVIGAQHVWASSPRQPGRGDGPFFLAVKRGAKDYAIVSFDTSDQKAGAEVLVEGITSPKTVLDEFRAFRTKAKAERDESRKASKSKAEPKAKQTKKVRKAKAS